MSYPSPQNGRHVRSLMHNVYSRYAEGIDLFPRMRVKPEAVDILPRKTTAIARTLARAWEIIDEDRSFFDEGVKTMVRAESGLVITRIGRNAVNMAFLAKTDKPAKENPIHFLECSISDFHQGFKDFEFGITDGRSFHYEDGEATGIEPDVSIVRTSNVAHLQLTPEAIANIRAGRVA